MPTNHLTGFSPGSVVLLLNPEEASALVAILRRVGGSPKTTRRKHTKAILDYLEGRGVIGNGTADLSPGAHIHFRVTS